MTADALPEPTADLMPEHVRAERREQAHQAITEALRHTWPEWRTRLRVPDFELLAAIALDGLGDLAAEILADGTLMKALHIENGVATLETEPARELLLAMVAAMRSFLDEHEAENYVEAEARRPSLSMDVQDGQTGEAYTFTVQRRYRPTPHEFRVQAERERDEARAALERVRELHQPIAGEAGTRWCQVCSQEDEQPQPVGWWVPWPCPTVQALGAQAAEPAGEATR